MNKLFGIKFLPMVAVPGNYVTAFFNDEAAAHSVLDLHAAKSRKRMYGRNTAFTFADLSGTHSMRADLFPYAMMFEVGPLDIAAKEINDRLAEARRVAGADNPVGFKSEREGEKQ